MKVLVIGGGGREHALVWKILQSARVKQVYCAPGNGGICSEGRVECIAWDGKDISTLLGISGKIEPDLTIVGPELPLTLGLVDEFNQRGLRIFGPTRNAARLEGSKGFAKEFMRRHAIPTAKYAVVQQLSELKDALAHFSGRIVVKADGLAAGKGVVIAQNRDEAGVVATEMLGGVFPAIGAAGVPVVLEEYLEGEELSFLVLSDGERVTPLACARDHKRIGEADTGANTGGMGAYSIEALIEGQMVEWIMTHIAKPVIDGMRAEESVYRGILYIGLMMTARGPEVLEFNCRFGDPETQAILMRLDSDIIEAFEAAIDGRVSDGVFKWSADSSACVVLASGGYPATYESGKRISGIAQADAIEGVKVFHAGTTKRDGDFYTSGGRVLGVTARGATLELALRRAYEAASIINFEDMYYRKDIGAKPLVR